MKKYKIEVIGNETTTTFELTLTESEFVLIEHLVKSCNASSADYYLPHLQPTMTIEEIDLSTGRQYP